MLEIIGILYILFLVFSISFQIGLVLGKPWGEYTMGGYNKGVLPAKLRLNAAFSVLILSFIALVIGVETNLLNTDISFHPNIIFGIVVFNILSVILNSITKSKKERNLWLPIVFIMLILSILILNSR